MHRSGFIFVQADNYRPEFMIKNLIVPGDKPADTMAMLLANDVICLCKSLKFCFHPEDIVSKKIILPKIWRD
jgi:hypothetical protein